MSRILPGVIAMAIIVVASNILVQFVILDGILTWGAFTYPFAFLVTDIMNRIYGPASARRVIYAGFAVGILCSLIGSRIMLDFGDFQAPAVALRVGIASLTAFLAAQLLDVAVFNRLRHGTWWRAPLVSSVLSSVLDTAIFFSLAFATFWNGIFPAGANEAISWAQAPYPLLVFGGDAPYWQSLAIADWGVKFAIAMVALVPFRIITARKFADMVK